MQGELNAIWDNVLPLPSLDHYAKSANQARLKGAVASLVACPKEKDQ